MEINIIHTKQTKKTNIKIAMQANICILNTFYGNKGDQNNYL